MSGEIQDGEEGISAEQEARIAGWRPREEFKGDPEVWTDADTFLERREHNVKMQRDSIEKLKREVARLSKQVGRADREGFNRAMEQIAQRKLDAVEVGDVQAFKEAEKAEKELVAKGNEPEVDQAKLKRDFIEWRSENTWYGTQPVISAWADQAAEDMMEERGVSILDLDGLNELAERVKAKFAKKFPDQFGAEDEGEESPKPRKRSPVEGVSQARGRGGVKTAADLDPRARQIAEQMVRQGLFKDVNEYAKELFNGQ